MPDGNAGGEDQRGSACAADELQPQHGLAAAGRGHDMDPPVRKIAIGPVEDFLLVTAEAAAKRNAGKDVFHGIFPPFPKSDLNTDIIPFPSPHHKSGKKKSTILSDGAVTCLCRTKWCLQRVFRLKPSCRRRSSKSPLNDPSRFVLLSGAEQKQSLAAIASARRDQIRPCTR